MVYSHGGSQQGAVFEELLNRKAAESGWVVRIESEEVTVGENTPPAQILKELNGLMAFAKTHLERMTDAARIETELEQVKNRFTETTRGNLRYIEATYKE
jgi:predicted ATPase